MFKLYVQISPSLDTWMFSVLPYMAMIWSLVIPTSGSFCEGFCWATAALEDSCLSLAQPLARRAQAARSTSTLFIVLGIPSVPSDYRTARIKAIGKERAKFHDGRLTGGGRKHGW